MRFKHDFFHYNTHDRKKTTYLQGSESVIIDCFYGKRRISVSKNGKDSRLKREGMKKEAKNKVWRNK